ncbi:MAG: hypothetical protein C0467_16080 [Planctomycetaceae bacterium]|nr:hypothetical protein [Planctomycetaceae bacterium]
MIGYSPLGGGPQITFTRIALLKMIRLTASTTKMVRDEADLDEENEVQSLRVPAAVFRMAVALAETTNRQFRAQGKQYFSARELLKGLNTWLASQQERTPRPRLSRQTSLDQLSDFFAVPANRKWLDKVVKFVEVNNGFTIED